MTERGETGRQAEDAALAHLTRAGLRPVARNWRCRFGEIDLILKDGDSLVFVEVRARAGSGFGGAAASITAAKQGRLKRAAAQYLATLPACPPCRFDAVLVTAGRLEWIRNAFGE